MASESTQTLIKMQFQTMSAHCKACLLAQQQCFREYSFHLVQTVKRVLEINNLRDIDVTEEKQKCQIMNRKEVDLTIMHFSVPAKWEHYIGLLKLVIKEKINQAYLVNVYPQFSSDFIHNKTWEPRLS